MKILITGMTSTQVGTSQKQFMTVIHPTEAMLEDCGHDVERREIRVDEDLSSYDKIICGLFPIEKMSATRKYSIFDAIARYPEKIMLIFDDWQYYQFQDSLRVCLNGGRFWNFVDTVEFANTQDINIIKAKPEIRPRMLKAAEEMISDLKYPLLFPKLWWGDISCIRVKTTGKILTYDIMDYAIEVCAKKMYKNDEPLLYKEKKWIMASVFDNNEYVNRLQLTWPVINLGHKNTSNFIPEHCLVSMYKTYAGIISHPYKKLGNDGWWRARWMHAVLCGNVILAEDSEAEGLPFDFFFSKGEIETADMYKLVEIANAQKECIMKGSPGCFDAADILDSYMS